MINRKRLRNQTEWAGEFQTMAYKMSSCTSEEQMYQQLRAFKDEFNSEYGKLSRVKRLTNGFRNRYDDE